MSTWGGVLLLGLVGAAWVMPAAAATAAADTPAKSANAKGQETQPGEAASPNRPTAEMTFAGPKRFAIITESGRERQRLYEEGDPLVDPADPSRTVRIQRIEPKLLRLKDSQTWRIVWVAEGKLVPGFPGWRFTGAASLTAMEFRYVATVGLIDPEPRLVRIHGARAILEVDVPPPPVDDNPTGAPRPANASARKPDATPFERVRVKQTTPNTYQLSNAELKEALDHGGRLLAEQWPDIQPVLSLRDGVGLEVKSPVADGVLSTSGFKVISPNLAGRLGIQAGDLILAINDQAVNSPGDLYILYRQAVQNPILSEVQVRLERQGVPVTKTYRIR